MRYSILILLVIGFLSSCTKEYTCKCTDTDQNGDVVNINSDIVEAKKRGEAEDKCNDKSGQFTVYTRSCEITNF